MKIRCRLFGHRSGVFAFYDWSRPDVFGICSRCDRCGADPIVLVQELALPKADLPGYLDEWRP